MDHERRRPLRGENERGSSFLGGIRHSAIDVGAGVASNPLLMRRLGLNRNGYLGERIVIAGVLRDIGTVARERGWTVTTLPSPAGSGLLALQRRVAHARRSVYLSAGIHGDEPAGPLALRELLREDAWPSDADLWMCPCLNAWGFGHNARNNRDGVDLNRDYRHLHTPEVRAHVAWLKQQPRFDLTLCLHEDWEASGFYVYELKTAGHAALSPRIVAAAARVFPIDYATAIDGRAAQGGMIFPSIEIDARPEWPEALYLFRHHTAQALTLEAASDFPLTSRVEVLMTGTRAALDGS